MRERVSCQSGWEGAVWDHAWRARLHPRHVHDELEFNLVLAGTGSYILPGGREHLRRGTLIWLFPECEHMLAELSRDFRMYIVVLTPRLVRRLVAGGALSAALAGADPPGRWSRRLSESVVAELAGLCAGLTEPTLAPAAANAGLAWLAVRAHAGFAAGSEMAALAPVHPAVREALRRLAEPGPPPSAGALARRCGLSPDRLARVFHAQVGERIAIYRNRLRVERAQALLAAGGADLTEIALEAGFGSYTHFHRCFVRVTGLAPSRSSCSGRGRGG